MNTELKQCSEDADWFCECDMCDAYWDSLEESIDGVVQEFDEELERDLDQTFEIDGW